MKVDVLLGLQWGDEGKGKVVDVIASKYDVIARFQGGPNAGHTLEFNDIKHVLHTIPSGVFQENTLNLVGNGVVIDPIVFKKEIEALEKLGVDIRSRLVLSKKAHLILPTHRLLDAASEASKGKKKIGSTLKGIGPTYMDKTGRNGLRIGDIFDDNFNNKYLALVEKHDGLLGYYNYQYELNKAEEEWFDSIEYIKTFKVVDSEHLVNQKLKENKSVLAEGAQGTLLDIDFGTYPYVTSSNTICAGACTGLGIAPNRIGNVYGIFKAYCTRVGSGPFPTELLDKTGEELQNKGNEFGATTGRPRRCGWLDLPALKYAIMINGVTHLIMTKADVLSQFEEIKVCTHYKIEDNEIDYFPSNIDDLNPKPIYKSFKGWTENIDNLSSMDELPAELEVYLDYLEAELEVPIVIVSVGPDRKQTLERKALA